MIRILIADDHPIVRRGLVAFLRTIEEFEIAAEAENGQAAVEMEKRFAPDVVVMDVNMPVQNGIEATEEIMRRNPQAKILMLTSFSEENLVIPALEAGASGYLLKENDPQIIADAIIALAKGEQTLDQKITRHVLAHMQGKSKQQRPLLTAREKEVLKEIAAGKSNKEISADLHISEKTVKTHVSNLLSKLQLQDRTQAAIYAINNGMIG
ncbi:response regulator [Bacillus testis]|uniref:response regulator n=1 Tax=Bacillus testis TaxID=1622072 RepID=UPI00067E892E|nr:response regulator transcription factor [Bacillus testis]